MKVAWTGGEGGMREGTEAGGQKAEGWTVPASLFMWGSRRSLRVFRASAPARREWRRGGGVWQRRRR